MQELLRREGGEEGRGVDCCPTVEEVVQPKGGRNMDGLYVELYSGAGPNSPYNHSQRFYEFSCREDVLNKPCRFVERKLRNQSRCEQKYSYQYAIVRADDYEAHGGGGLGPGPGLAAGGALFSNGTTGWKLDYISLRSGCSCVVTPRRAASKRGKRLGGGGGGGGGPGAVPRLDLDDPLDNT
ncbi:Ras-related protein Rab-7b [Frankliniella fusca]|uniref:Ras-related protein Rab-7b n=1 Tax=Frankliniella fusca TaxID=407009 RepID=A0AAE1LQ64_9NEOP|nr:Ras-related protein Rab-7b [Frankliniella fusca]